MTIARANCRAVWCATASSMAPSRRWTCQSSGRRMVMLSVMAQPLIAVGGSRHYLGAMGTWLSDRALIRIAGDDPRDFLQGLVTSDMRGALPVWTGLLSPQGKALFDFIVWPDGEALLIDCEAAVAEPLARRLTMYRLRRAITIEPAAGGVHWSAEGSEGVPDPRLAGLGRRWLGEASGDSADGWRTHRLALGVPEGRAGLGDGETLWR